MGKESKSRGCLGWFLVIVILALVVGAVVYTIKKKIDHSNDDKPAPVPENCFEGVWAELMGYFSIRPRPENCLAPAHHFVATAKHPTSDLLCVSVGFQLSSLCYMPNYFLKSWINFGRDHEFSKVISYREGIDPAGSCRTLYLGILVEILSHY